VTDQPPHRASPHGAAHQAADREAPGQQAADREAPAHQAAGRDATAHQAAGREAAETHAGHDPGREGREEPRLGQLLREAREQAGLGLSDLAEVTHVRRVHLAALEEGRYADLPEDVYARNFVRLYANAVGLEAEPSLQRYAAERRRALARPGTESRAARDRRDPALAVAAARNFTPARRRRVAPAWLSGPWLPTLALVVVVIGLATWGFNQLFAPTGREPAITATPTPSQPAEGPAGAAEGLPSDAATSDAAGEAAVPTQVRVSIATDPPGASVTIDGFPVPGVTPLLDVPVTAREGRVVRAELDGYQAGEVSADLRQDAALTLTLTPLVAGEAVAAAAGAGDGSGALVITITDTTWLEVYRSTARNVGERLVYTTAQSGQRYQFQPPVFVYTGNAAGVRLSLDGQDLGPMGSPGAVTGRAFPE
jgi:cytoskeleton protein RodZ